MHEVLSCVIEGIPNQGLRNQAHIQCFVDIGHIKRAFADVSLPKSYGVGRKTTSTDPKAQQEDSLFQLQSQRALVVRVPEVEAGERIVLCVR